ncbi:MAG: TetR/AcrR family transcriptional regulator [Deltaproteobacteria bacterium]|nr:TetR/AcrR family transcriptional regulator [Deltaproteobacteria bacterium]
MSQRMSAGGRREQILRGAMGLFAQKGFRGTTTREIARRLKISEALMFKYFPSKRALFSAIIQMRMDGSEEMLFPPEAVQAKDDRQVFRSIASFLVQRNTKDPTFLRLILYSALEDHDLSRSFFENHAREKMGLLAAYIRQRIKEKVFREVPPLLAARAFIGMIIHFVEGREIFGFRDASSPVRSAEVLVDIFLQGLKGNAREK